MKKNLLLIGLILQLASNGQTPPQMRKEDKISIREAITISNKFGNSIWPGINDAPFVVLLVTDSVEFLVNHPYPSSDFKISEEDEILKAKIFYRKRQYSKEFLATFPAVNGVNCIVVGTPENTGMSPTAWIITLLHEHFHQYQYFQKGYYDSVAALDLANGDKTGMWQLNYLFPYESSSVNSQYLKYTTALSKAVSNVNNKDFKKTVVLFGRERKKLMGLFTPTDYRYISFQLWQEGIARYTEYKFLQLLDDYIPAAEVTQLSGFISFREFKEQFLKSHLASVTAMTLNKEKRVCFYDIGLAEGILLDKQNPHWRSHYLTNKFFIEKYTTEVDVTHK